MKCYSSEISHLLEDAIEEWHLSDNECSLHEFLNMTWEEFVAWYMTDILPENYKFELREKKD